MKLAFNMCIPFGDTIYTKREFIVRAVLLHNKHNRALNYAYFKIFISKNWFNMRPFWGGGETLQVTN
jgi:hypothetical protein